MKDRDVEIGRYNRLRVLETGTHGAILDGGSAGRLLLANQQCPPNLQAGDELAVQDEPRLDGLTETHLVSQQHARRKARGHLHRDGDLVWQQAGARAQEPTHVG